jgi:hypothetical protein
MDKSFNQFSKVVNKHVLGNQEEFTRLKDKLEVCEHATSKAGAAALGYLMAMEEMEELKSEAGISVYDKVKAVVDSLIACDGNYYAESACDEIFTTIYEWLDDELERVGNAKESSETRTMFRDEMHNDIGKLFREYLVQQ